MSTEINVDLFRKVQAAITADATRFDMDDWGGSIDEDDLIPLIDEKPTEACGTAFCIAGHAALIAEPELSLLLPKLFDFAGWLEHSNHVYNRLSEGMSDLGCKDAWIFYHSQWPDDLHEQLMDAETPQKRAAVACRAIDRFIEERAQ